jgi:hypothetical protein
MPDGSSLDWWALWFSYRRWRLRPQLRTTGAYNGIEGTNGTTTTLNKADVTSAGQLLTVEAAPYRAVRL